MYHEVHLLAAPQQTPFIIDEKHIGKRKGVNSLDDPRKTPNDRSVDWRESASFTGRAAISVGLRAAVSA
jgi:hypothetical protein